MADRHKKYIQARRTSKATGNPIGKVYTNSVRKPNLKKSKPTKLYVDTMPKQELGGGNQRKFKATKQFGSLGLEQEYVTGQSSNKQHSYQFNKSAATLDVPIGLANVQLRGSKSTNRSKLKTSGDMISKYKQFGIPDVEQRETVKTSTFGGKLVFPVGEAKVALFGDKTIKKGNQSSEFGNFENSFKSIEKNVGANLGYKLTENSRVGLYINKKWFNKQKTGNNMELDYSTEIFGNKLHVTLGKYENGEMKEKAATLAYDIPTDKFMRFFK